MTCYHLVKVVCYAPLYLRSTPLQDVARDARVARFMSGPCNQLLRASAYVVKLYYANEAVLRSAIAFGRQS